MAGSGQAQVVFTNPPRNDQHGRNPKNRKTIMNNKLTLTTLAIAALGIGIAASAPARAASGLLDKCHINNNRQVVEKCCNTWTRQRGKPMWFNSDSSCSSVVACSVRRGPIGIVAVGQVAIVGAAAMKAAYVPKCGIVMPLPSGGGRGDVPRAIAR